MAKHAPLRAQRRREARRLADHAERHRETPLGRDRRFVLRTERRALRRVRRAQQRDRLGVPARANKTHADPRLREQPRLLKAERAGRAYNLAEDELRVRHVRLAQVPVGDTDGGGERARVVVSEHRARRAVLTRAASASSP